MVISVKRKGRRSEKLLRGLMIFLAVLFLLQGILFSTGFMLPCLLTTGAYFWYSHASRREYEYTIEDGRMLIERVASTGRTAVLKAALLDRMIPLAELEIPAE